MSLSCTQVDGDHLAGQVTCPACSMMRRITDAIDDVLGWRGGADAGDYPFDWPEQDYELIAQSVSEAIGLAALLAIAEEAQTLADDEAVPLWARRRLQSKLAAVLPQGEPE